MPTSRPARKASCPASFWLAADVLVNQRADAAAFAEHQSLEAQFFAQNAGQDLSEAWVGTPSMAG